jgi:hypothetical protein
MFTYLHVGLDNWKTASSNRAKMQYILPSSVIYPVKILLLLLPHHVPLSQPVHLIIMRAWQCILHAINGRQRSVQCMANGNAIKRRGPSYKTPGSGGGGGSLP